MSKDQIFKDMRVGTCVELYEEYTYTLMKQINATIYSMTHRISKTKYNNRKYVLRRVDNKLRIWRIK